MRFLSAAVLVIALSGCQHISQGLDYVDQKIIPAGTVIVKSQTLIQLSEAVSYTHLTLPTTPYV